MVTLLLLVNGPSNRREHHQKSGRHTGVLMACTPDGGSACQWPKEPEESIISPVAGI